VYAEASADLGLAELEATLGRAVSNLALDTLAGVRYLTFTADALDAADFHALSRLSVAYALFARPDGDSLLPVALPRGDVYDSDLVTIQRYVGKTNEYFTKLLVNLTVANATVAGPPTILDPLAGRGTTLNQATVYGWNACGVEIDRKGFDAYKIFITTWLKNKRLPHKARDDSLSVDGTKNPRLTVELAVDRATFDAGERQRSVIVNGDTRRVDRYFKANSVDCIVADLPYGVRHGSHKSAADRQRSPDELVEASLDAWLGVLRPKGAMGLAWNTKVTPRRTMVAMCARAGLDVLDDGAYTRFEHRVDQSIVRDLLIARRPAAGEARAV
jgi:hypothetical protein